MPALERLTKEQVEEAARLYIEGGHTYESLANYFGVSMSTVYSRLRPFVGKQRTMARLTDKQKAHIVRLYKVGKATQPELAEKFCVKPAAINNILSNAGVLKKLKTPKEWEDLHQEAMKLVAEGELSKHKIAKKLKIGFGKVVEWTKGTRSVRKESTTSEQEEQIRRLFLSQRYHNNEIAEKVGVGVGVVNRVLRGMPPGVRGRTRRKEANGTGFILRQPGHPFGDDYEVDPDTECWLWLWSKDTSGYARVMHHGKNASVIRLLAKTPQGMETRHSTECGDRRHCMNPEHLTPGTQRENQKDRRRNEPRRQLEYRVRERRKEGLSYKEFASEFSLTYRQVSHILSIRVTRRLVLSRRDDGLTYPQLAEEFQLPIVEIRTILSAS